MSRSFLPLHILIVLFCAGNQLKFVSVLPVANKPAAELQLPVSRASSTISFVNRNGTTAVSDPPPPPLTCSGCQVISSKSVFSDASHSCKFSLSFIYHIHNCHLFVIIIHLLNIQPSDLPRKGTVLTHFFYRRSVIYPHHALIMYRYNLFLRYT